MLLYDTFTDDDGTDLSAHTPDIDTVGGGWTEESGDWEITSNQVYEKNVQAWAWARIDAGVYEGTWQIDKKCGDDALQVQFCICYTDASNYIYIITKAGTAGDDFFLGEYVDGTPATLDDADIDFDKDTTYTIKVTRSGNAMEVFVDDVSKLSGTCDGSLTDTDLFIRLQGSSLARFDNLIVTALGAGIPLIMHHRKMIGVS